MFGQQMLCDLNLACANALMNYAEVCPQYGMGKHRSGMVKKSSEYFLEALKIKDSITARKIT